MQDMPADLPAGLPAGLNEAMAAEPAWLSAWLLVLGGTHFISIFFVAWRADGQWGFRWEPLAIIGSLMVAGLFMNELYDRVGYVRLLGLAHLVCWAPIYGWLLYRRRAIGFSSLWGKYVHMYLLIAGISLVVDAIDVVRYLVGDSGNLYMRWG